MRRLVFCFMRQGALLHSLFLVKESTPTFSHRILLTIDVSSMYDSCTPG